MSSVLTHCEHNVYKAVHCEKCEVKQQKRRLALAKTICDSLNQYGDRFVDQVARILEVHDVRIAR